MPRRITKPRQHLRRTFIKEWRLHRDKTQDQIVERMRELVPTFSKASLSRIENGKQPYSQPILEAMSVVLDCAIPDLLIRNPLDPEAPWSIYDTLKETERRQADNFIKNLKQARG